MSAPAESVLYWVELARTANKPFAVFCLDSARYWAERVIWGEQA
jgi:hypothetical protein